ncbi:DUF4920 domain-containing protein [Ferrimonas futtsuensis]|uniref:DUF4920 domain-containing protein n=1 Tax=Ferrimonas futtsuensis TaxID=364764 RepID=UPI000411A99F|nr:DUF4920 domain-containing protein [Ferrimonas futtsuensis]
MRIKTLITALALCLSATIQTHASDQGSSLDFGTPVEADNITKISTLMASPDNYLDKPVTIEGTIVAVCEKRGCWMKIASDKQFQNLRVKVKDGEMVFPVSTKGSTAIATGKLQKLEYDLERTRKMKAHWAEEKGEKFDPASVTEPMTMYQLVPTGVSILEQ